MEAGQFVGIYFLRQGTLHKDATASIPPAGFPFTVVVLAFLLLPWPLDGAAIVVMIAVVTVAVMVMGIVLGPLMLVLAPAVMLVGMLTVVTSRPTTANSTDAMTTTSGGMTSTAATMITAATMTTAASMTSAPATPVTVGMDCRNVEAHHRQKDHSYHQCNRQKAFN